MKTKKILLAVLVGVIVFTAIVSNNIFASDTVTEIFNQILNEDGKLVVTDTSMCEDMNYFLQQYLQKYKTDSYDFVVQNYNSEDSTCYIYTPGFEGRTVEVVFEEKISDEFKSILTDGKIKIPSSTKNGVNNVLSAYLYNMSELSDKYRYEVGYYSDMNGYELLIDENCTKATIKMLNKSWKVLEQHIVELTYLTEQSKAFQDELTEDGKIVFNSIKPKTEDELGSLFELLFVKDNSDKGYSWGYPSEDFTSMDFTINAGTVNEETHRVEIVYNYDEKVAEKLQEFVKNFPENIEFFHVKDLELVNYWINNVQIDDTEHLDAYSGELKEAINNNNIEYYVDNRAGDDGAFFTERQGIAIFKFEGIVYHVDTVLGTRAENVIYVPDETENTRSALIAAAQKRINEYLKNENLVKVTYSGNAYDSWVKGQYKVCKWMWEQDDPDMTLEEFIANKDEYLSYTNFEEAVGIEGVTEDSDAFKLTVNVNGKEKDFYIFIKKDSSKMVTPTYSTLDMNTKIKITTQATSIPLDTSIQAMYLTSGEEYEEIINTLNVEDNLMYDLKLYSDSLNGYFKRLENDSFEVRIPIPEGWDKKNLVAYYVDDNNDKEVYSVELKEDGDLKYAVFQTNHFSIYTLAEGNVSDDKNNNGSNSNGNINDENFIENEGVNSDNKEVVNNDKEVTKNPQTGDNILFFVIVLVISIIGITATNKIQKYYSKK